MLTLEDAEATCKSYGTPWTITRKAYGAAVCSTVGWLDNCNNCDSWRLLVWNDGACADFYCRSNRTKAGHFYCGNEPCEPGNFLYGGTWGKGNK